MSDPTDRQPMSDQTSETLAKAREQMIADLIRLGMPGVADTLRDLQDELAMALRERDEARARETEAIQARMDAQAMCRDSEAAWREAVDRSQAAEAARAHAEAERDALRDRLERVRDAIVHTRFEFKSDRDACFQALEVRRSESSHG